MSRSRLLATCGIAVMTASYSQPGLCADPVARLTYAIHHKQCPSSEQYADWVTSRLGRSLFADSADTSVELRLVETPQRWVVSLRITGPSMLVDREFRGTASQCADLVEAAASATAIAFDAQGRVPRNPEPPPATPPAATAPAPIAEPSPPPSTPPAQPPPDHHTHHWHMGAGVMAWWMVPSMMAGFQVMADYRFTSRWSLGLRGEWAGTLSESKLDTADTASFEVVTATLPICVRNRSLLGCMSARGGMLRSHMEGVSQPNQSTGLWTLGPEMQLVLPLSSAVSLTSSIQVHLAVSRAHIELDGATVWRMSPVVGGWGLGVRGAID